jgi:hypothetical protein
VGGENVYLFERVAIDEVRDALASSQLAFRMLPVERLCIAMTRLVFPLA